MSDDRPYQPGFYAWYGRESPIDRINKQIAGIIERCQKSGQDVPADHISDLKRQVYELGG